MSLTIDYYASLSSPWTYLGHARLGILAQKYQARINLKPVEFGAVFGATGGLPLAKRAPERQNYRFQELERWRKELDIDLNLRPKFFPVLPTIASLMCLYAEQEGLDSMKFAGAVLRAVWSEEKDISDETTVIGIADSCGFDGSTLLQRSNTSEITARYDSYAKEAIARGVFGAPSYVINDEIFWGQDRLIFVEKKLREES